jgi:signal transduction histidine kinase
VYTDITDRRRQEQQVQVLNRILRHNLRNKANVIHGQATHIQDKVGGEVGDALLAISRASEDLLALSEKTTRLRQANQHDSSSDGETIDLLLDEVIAEIRDEYGDVRITTNVPEKVGLLGGELLKIALYEVIENAVKHSEQPERAVEVTISQMDQAERWTEITVIDDGPGLPEMEQEVIEAGLETPLQHGSGLGLWVVNWIVKSLGGDFTIESPEGAGAKITFKLPRGNCGSSQTTGAVLDESEW